MGGGAAGSGGSAAGEWEVGILQISNGDVATDMAADGDGGVLIATGKAAIARYDSTGRPLANLPAPDRAPAWKGSDIYFMGVAVDASNEIYGAGALAGVLPGEQGKTAGYYDLLVAHYAVTGSLGWSHQLGSRETTADTYAQSVGLDDDGNVYVSAFSKTLIAGQLDAANDATYQRLGGAVLAKYGSDGARSWFTQLSDDTDIIASLDLAVDSSGSSYLIGEVRGVSNRETLIAKVSADGAKQWVSYAGSWLLGDRIALAPSENWVYFTGYSQVAIGTSSVQVGRVGRMSADGMIEWLPDLIARRDSTLCAEPTCYGTVNTNDIAVARDGSVYVVGGVVGFLPGFDKPTASEQDVFVAKYAPSGALEWLKQLGSDYQGEPQTEYAARCVVDSNSGLVVSGYTAGDLEGRGRYTRGAYSFLARFEADGTLD